VKLVLAPHGMHWTGYTFNDFSKTLQILQWVATKIPARQVLVFLPAWDGRYYWDYPVYEPDPRLGGEAGFRNLIQQGQRLGFHFMPMFGANSAAQHLDVYPRLADAATAQIDGDPFELNYVDWDNDRHFEGGMSYMNLGVDSWREWLFHRISRPAGREHGSLGIGFVLGRSRTLSTALTWTPTFWTSWADG